MGPNAGHLHHRRVRPDLQSRPPHRHPGQLLARAQGVGHPQRRQPHRARPGPLGPLGPGEHAAYFSAESDDYVIRRTVFFGSKRQRPQVNVEPLASWRSSQAPRARGRPHGADRDWALALLKKATDASAPTPSPTGAVQLHHRSQRHQRQRPGRPARHQPAGVRESLVQNNLVYGNHSAHRRVGHATPSTPRRSTLVRFPPPT